jgi:nitrite reductase/ring-hydroxylating ferredoxin subunit
MAGSDEWRCAAATVTPGHTEPFRLERARHALNAFVVNHDGQCRAYVNRYPHVGTPLDLWPNEFFTEDGREPICSTHGPRYEPLSGRWTAAAPASAVSPRCRWPSTAVRSWCSSRPRDDSLPEMMGEVRR